MFGKEHHGLHCQNPCCIVYKVYKKDFSVMFTFSIKFCEAKSMLWYRFFYIQIGSQTFQNLFSALVYYDNKKNFSCMANERNSSVVIAFFDLSTFIEHDKLLSLPVSGALKLIVQIYDDISIWSKCSCWVLSVSIIFLLSYLLVDQVHKMIYCR